MLGSLSLYRRLLFEHVFCNQNIRTLLPFASKEIPDRLPSFGHGIAGMMAGSTVSFIAAPVEHVKARLQIQYAADKKQRLYSGPIDCTRKIVSFPMAISALWPCLAKQESAHSVSTNSSAIMEFRGSIMGFARRSFFDLSSSFGGEHMIYFLAQCRNIPSCRHQPSISGLADYPHRSFGSRPIHPTL